MAKWDLSKLPEGRKPLPDEWFRERAQMQERIEELEAKVLECGVDIKSIQLWGSENENEIAELRAKLAKAMKTLEFYADGEWPQDYPGGVLYASGDDTPEFKTHLDYGDKARTTIAELKGESDD
jgi:hypothetical protein